MKVPFLHPLIAAFLGLAGSTLRPMTAPPAIQFGHFAPVEVRTNPAANAKRKMKRVMGHRKVRNMYKAQARLRKLAHQGDAS